MHRVTTACAFLLLLPVAVRAAPQRSFAELLPADTIGYVEANALSAAERKLAVAYRCLAEPEMRRALDRLMSEKGNFSRAAIPVGRGTIRLQADIRESGAAFDVEFENPKGSERVRFRDNLAVAWVALGKEGSFGVDAVVALQVDGDTAPAYRLARKLLAAVKMRKQRTKMKGRAAFEAPLEEYGIGQVRCTAADIGPVRLHFAVVGQRLVFTTTRARLTDIIERTGKPAANSLAQTERFASIAKHAGGTGTMAMLGVLNIDRAAKALAGHHPQLIGIPTYLKTTGLGGLRAITSTSRADGAGVAGTTSVLLEGRRVGLGRLFEKSEPAKFGTLAFAPKDTLYVASGRFDPPAMTRMIGEVAAMALSGVAQVVYQETGVNLYADVLHVMGPEAALIVSSNQGLIPDVGIVFESRDAAKLEKALLKALTKVNWKQGTGVFPARLAGTNAHVIKMLHPRMSEVPIAPTFGIVDGHFVIALFPVSYQRFANTKRGHRPSIEKNEDYVALRKRVPADALSLSYLDLKRIVGTGYDTLIPLLQSLPQTDGAMSVHEMPDASIFMRHLYGRIAWRTADDRGMHWHSHSSVDLSPLVLGFVAGAGAAVSLAGVRVDERAPPQQVTVGATADAVVKMRELRRCSSNVRELLQVLRLHRKRSGGFPPTLEAAAKGWVAPRSLEVPGHPGKRYRYFGPDGKGGILLAGRPNGPDDRVCVIRTNLKMERLTPEQLHNYLEHGTPKRQGSGK